MNFFARWLERFCLSPQDWPREVAASPDEETALLADAFAWCCYAFWQCKSAFPALPENYARFLKDALETPVGARPESAIVQARLISEFNAGDGRCGFNRFTLKDAETIRDSERLNYEGRYEVYLKAQDKKGEDRYKHICKALGLRDTGDYRQIRALLSAGKKSRQG